MKVLILHPQDAFPVKNFENCWDLVVDLGRAPRATYEEWRKQTACRVLSLYQFVEEIEDLGRIRQLLQLGLGSVVDDQGIDWWSVLSLEILPQIQQLMLIHRLSKELHENCKLYSSRPDPLAAALRKILGVPLITLEGGFQSVVRKVHQHHETISQLDPAQFVQVLEDKWDANHSIRRRFVRRGSNLGRPLVLLPSAYSNASRTALAYAELLPELQFLLVFTRRNGELRLMPPNVCSASLAPYFVSANKRETTRLLDSWQSLRKRLVGTAREFKSAEEEGVLARIPALVRWGIALRDAWRQLFESENVIACLSADHHNPPSAIPLLMAKQREIPALACHHGALDYQMAINTNHADFYLAKGEMERDFLTRVCRLAREKIVVAPPRAFPNLSSRRLPRRSASWLVFFTEPYGVWGWRSEEVYRDLLPRLYSLAQFTETKLVFKLHPFESPKGHRRMLRRLIPEHEREIEIIAGPPTPQLWSNTRFALTVQSSTALECAALDIPVFLCAWLRDSFSGYVQQYARFGVGRVLESPEQITDIACLLEEEGKNRFQIAPPRRDRERAQLAELFSGTCALPAASNG